MVGASSDRAEGAVHRRWAATHAILFALLAVVVSFVASTAYTEKRTAGIDTAAMSIADNAAPSIESLASARADIRRLQALVSDYVNDAVLGRPGDLEAVVEARSALSRDIDVYLVLPVYPGERDLWHQVSADLEALDAVIDRVLSLVSQGQASQANDLADHALRAAFNRASDAIMLSIDFNARQARALARTIEEDRRTARWITLGLDALSVALAAITGWVAVALVRRHERLLRESLLVERRASELDIFAARVAHDIAGSLGTVVLANHLVAAKLAGDPGAEKTMARGERAAQRIQRIVDGLLDFARAGATPEAGARADVGLVVEDAAGELVEVAKAADAELRVEPFAPCAVAASPGVLTTLIANLARNAIKYLGDAPVRRVVLRVLDAGDAVCVEVEDTGPGVSPELEGVIFQPYVRGPGNDEPGLGLGLATVKSLVEGHAGRVGLRSTIGRGSTFWFELPKPGLAPPARLSGDARTHAA